MNQIEKFVKWGIGPIYNRYHSLCVRLAIVELALDCLIKTPKYIDSSEVGFNGQAGRKKIFDDLLAAFGFETILETGTWLGNTTGYMSRRSGLPVSTADVNDRFQGLAKMRLSDLPGISFYLLDSREFLARMADSPLASQRVFLYLDAHWEEQLPLAEEIAIVSKCMPKAIIMIDDFEVPGDQGYFYDDYGKGKSLDMATFGPVFKQHGQIPFFPALSSGEETGKRRGCVILGREGPDRQRLQELSSLVMRGAVT